MKQFDFIKSPINYTGNKYRLLPQFLNYFPKKTKMFVDLFCGGATVGINVVADKIIMIDNNPRVISLLKYLAKEDINKIVVEIEKIIEKYNLTYTAKYGYKFYKKDIKDNNGLKQFNKNGFYKLRDDYNAIKDKDSDKANTMLYTLIVYGFNNDIRFNKKGEFNIPIGKTDFNKNNLKKIIAYNNRVKGLDIEFICADYNSEEAKKYIFQADFVYIDPPYLITTAVYNEESKWNEDSERKLVNLLEELNKKNIQFALSNVLSKAKITNQILEDWSKKNNNIRIHNIDYDYRSCSYNKKDRDSHEREVLIMNELFEKGGE